VQSRPAIAAEPLASAAPQRPVAIPPAAPQYRPPPVPAAASEIVDARRHSLMAMGGTVASLVLGVFALIIAPFRFEAAVIAVIGLFMGIWGLYSPRRGLALAALLLCCLGIAIGTYTGMRALYFRIKQNQPVTMEDAWEDPSLAP
jgi:hypothetical protein